MAAAQILCPPSADPPLPCCCSLFALRGTATVRTSSPSHEFHFFSTDSLVTRLPNRRLRSQRRADSSCVAQPFVHANARRMYPVCAWFALCTSDSCAVFAPKGPSCAPNTPFPEIGRRRRVLVPQWRSERDNKRRTTHFARRMAGAVSVGQPRR